MFAGRLNQVQSIDRQATCIITLHNRSARIHIILMSKSILIKKQNNFFKNRYIFNGCDCFDGFFGKVADNL